MKKIKYSKKNDEMKKLFIFIIVVSSIMIISMIIIFVRFKKNIVQMHELSTIVGFVCAGLCFINVITIIICLIRIKHLK